jgi:hypothetical protein
LRRSQFIYVTYRGTPKVFWQTPKAAASARPGLRIPFSHTNGAETYYIDSQERYGYSFAGQTCVRQKLRVGDYAVIDDRDDIIAAIERKTMDDFATSLVDASLSFQMMELAALPRAAVVVEATYSQVLRHKQTRSGFLAELVARLAVLYPNVPIVFLESRRLAEHWTLRYLHHALVNARPMGLPFGSKH